MGKDIKGKDLGKGITQNKTNKLYYARFISVRTHKTIEEHFKTVEDARAWYEKAVKADKRGTSIKSPNMTVDEWFYYWMEEHRGCMSPYTVVSDVGRYEKSIQPVIGNMRMYAVETRHCKKVLNNMVNSYADGTIKRTYYVMKNLFEDAVYDELIDCSPVRIKKKEIPSSNIVDEQIRALEYTPEQMVRLENAIKNSKTKYKLQFLLSLEFGGRVGELSGLRIGDLDFENRIIHIRQQCRYVKGKWSMAKTKHANLTKPSKNKKMRKFEDIPMTDTAYELLLQAVENRKKIVPAEPRYKDILFLSSNGRPITNSSYWKMLSKITDRNGLPHISMHCFRHFFGEDVHTANGCDTKSTQACMRHEHFSTTYDWYVNINEEKKNDSMRKLQEYRDSRRKLCSEIV